MRTDASSTTTTTSSLPRPQVVNAPTAVAWANGENSTLIIDVRTPGEYTSAHISGSHNVPLDLLNWHAEVIASHLKRSPHVLLVCQSGMRATRAQRHLSAQGLQHVTALQDGVPAFEAAGGDVVHGTGRWAIDRQVRLIAGSIVLSSVLASIIAPRTRFLAGAIGAGLAYSAISNSCAMAAVLGKLPYNRETTDPTTDSVLQELRIAH